jgi:hypothetical protein
MRAQWERKMSDEATIDEAANTALLLEQHIQKKMAHAVNDFLFSDSIAGHRMLDAAIEGDNLAFAAHKAREELALQIVHSSAFQNNLNYLVKNVVREEMTELRQMVREEFARGIIHNTHNANRTG